MVTLICLPPNVGAVREPPSSESYIPEPLQIVSPRHCRGLPTPHQTCPECNRRIGFFRNFVCGKRNRRAAAISPSIFDIPCSIFNILFPLFPLTFPAFSAILCLQHVIRFTRCEIRYLGYASRDMTYEFNWR